MKKSSQKPLSGKSLVDAIVKAAEGKLAEQISIVEMDSTGGVSDYFIICQADTTVHNQAIVSNVIRELGDHGTHPWHVEGTEDGRWILVDFSDVVVHVMLPELREYYKLEKLGNKNKTKPLQ